MRIRTISAAVLYAAGFVLAARAAHAEPESRSAAAPPAAEASTEEPHEKVIKTIPYAGRMIRVVESTRLRIPYLPAQSFGMIAPPGIAIHIITVSALKTKGQPTSTYLNFSISAGVVKNLAATVSYLPIKLRPDAGFGSLGYGLTYEFVQANECEMGATINATINPSGKGSLFSPLTASVPMIFRGGDLLRIELTPSLSFMMGNAEKKITAGLSVPVGAGIQIVDPLYAHLSSGVRIPDLKAPGAGVSVPLGFSLRTGFNMKKDEQPIWLFTTYEWPSFWMPGSSDQQRVNLSTLAVSLTAFFLL